MCHLAYHKKVLLVVLFEILVMDAKQYRYLRDIKDKPDCVEVDLSCKFMLMKVVM